MLRIAQVLALTGLGKTKIYELQNQGDFPMRVQLTPKRVAWVEAEVQAWLAARIASSTPLVERWLGYSTDGLALSLGSAMLRGRASLIFTVSEREIADVSGVSLPALTALRAGEATQPRLRTMRHNYTRKIDSYVTRLSTEARSTRDVLEIERQFQEEVADDIAMLREQLKDEGKKVLFTKETIGAAAIVAAGVFIEPTAALFAAMPLYKAKTDYRTARNKTLENHSMSWLYETQRVKVF